MVLFNVSCELAYTVGFPSTLILNVHAQRSASQTILSEQFTVVPDVPVSEFSPEGSPNRFIRLETGAATHLAIAYAAAVQCEYQTYDARAVEATPVAGLTGDAIPYLFPSRYCQSDRLSRLAWDLFGAIENPHAKVVSIADWIHQNVEYQPGSTNSMTSAFDTVTQRTGVCRDFAHLGIALCRALNLPARYFSGYAYQVEPPDFHACFECLIDGNWVVFDATQMAFLNGLVRIGTGRDAADAAVATMFGGVRNVGRTVGCTLGEGQTFEGVGRAHLDQQGISLVSTA